MYTIDWDHLDRELEHCHPALMKVWNQFRDQMHRRGIETFDVLQDVAVKILAKRNQFHGTTRGEFCQWIGTIMRRHILTELDRLRPAIMDSAPNYIDRNQERPSVVFQTNLRFEAYALAFASLPERESVLIELKFVSKYSVRKVGEQLRKYHVELWKEYGESWTPEEPRLRKACELARVALDKAAAKYHRLLEGGATSDNFIGP